MEKIRLVGKKLYRIGPLKCFKQGHYGHGTGGEGTSISKTSITYGGTGGGTGLTLGMTGPT